MKVCVVILNWNGWRDTLECLESLFKSSYTEFSVIVCDNFSTDDSITIITQWASRIFKPEQFVSLTEEQISDYAKIESTNRFILISNNANHGFAGGNNVGIRLALKSNDCEFIWLLNNDTTIESKALELLVEKINSNERIGICGSLLCYYHNKNLVQAIGGVTFNLLLARGVQIGQGLANIPNQIDSLAMIQPTYIAGASMLVRKKLILDIGYMEEKYFLYFEEIDWAERCFPNWILAVAPNSIIYHKEGSTIGTSSLATRSTLSQYYLNRNLILFYYKFHPFLLPISILRVFREVISNIKNSEYSLLKTTCRALRDGLLRRDGMQKIYD